MEYRQLPHGTENEKFGVLGLGFGGIGTTPVEGSRSPSSREIWSSPRAPSVRKAPLGNMPPSNTLRFPPPRS